MVLREVQLKNKGTLWWEAYLAALPACITFCNELEADRSTEMAMRIADLTVDKMGAFAGQVQQ